MLGILANINLARNVKTLHIKEILGLLISYTNPCDLESIWSSSALKRWAMKKRLQIEYFLLINKPIWKHNFYAPNTHSAWGMESIFSSACLRYYRNQLKKQILEMLRVCTSSKNNSVWLQSYVKWYDLFPVRQPGFMVSLDPPVYWILNNKWVQYLRRFSIELGREERVTIALFISSFITRFI